VTTTLRGGQFSGLLPFVRAKFAAVMVIAGNATYGESGVLAVAQ
jgi:hypothetical protein